MMKKMLLILVIMMSALLSVGLANPGYACDFRVYKFNDLNGNGQWDDGEPGIGGWNIRIFIDQWRDGTNWVEVAQGVTDEWGWAHFTNLPGDYTYRVWEAQKDCWIPTTPAVSPWMGGYYTQLYAPSGSSHTILFGNKCEVGEGCTPGYWRNHLDSWGPTGFSPADDFDTTFGVDLFDPDITLEQAVWARGGGVNRLARHGTAALLSAAHPDVDYLFSVAEVIAAVQVGDADSLAQANELGCPLD